MGKGNGRGFSGFWVVWSECNGIGGLRDGHGVVKERQTAAITLLQSTECNGIKGKKEDDRGAALTV